MNQGKINPTSTAVTMTMSESRFCMSWISRKSEISCPLCSTETTPAICLQLIEDWGGVILNLEIQRVWSLQWQRLYGRHLSGYKNRIFSCHSDTQLNILYNVSVSEDHQESSDKMGEKFFLWRGEGTKVNRKNSSLSAKSKFSKNV